MPETIEDKKVFTLREVTLSIQRTIAERYKSTFWVKAEMNKLNHYSHSGHCYPELVEKQDGKVIAQVKSILWKKDYERVNNRFLSVLKEPIKDGIKILFCASISFDPTYGLCLKILDIDPTFSLGELEREKQETIQALVSEGIFSQNKKKKLPLLPQRIAVISVETSKGYADYLKVVEQNPWGYKFFNFLFPALLQGDKSVPSILYQLKRIRKAIHHFDAVAIIRGGGGDVGLSSYNNVELAREVAQFPIPVFTGIGHSTNETVVEMVSYRNAITPTELADFLIQAFHNFSVPVQRAEELIADRARRTVRDEAAKLHGVVRFFQTVAKNQVAKDRSNVESTVSAIERSCRLLFAKYVEELEGARTQLNKRLVDLFGDHARSLNALERNVKLLDPIHILRRGFTMTVDERGKVISDLDKLVTGDVIKTVFAEGEITSTVVKTKKNDE